MFRLVLIVLSAITALSAAVVLTNWLSDASALNTWLLIKMAAVVVLLLVSLSTAWYFRRDVTKIPIEARLVVGGLLLVGLGAASIAFSLHLDKPERGVEWWALVLSLATTGQGFMTVWHLWRCSLRREERHIMFEV
jgi:small neutral amino acid transporter SnatA (MarC family)